MKKSLLMKSLLLLFALVVGTGSMWADTYTYNFSSGGTNSTSTNTWTTTYFSILQEKGSSATNVANYLTSPRWYKGHIITITPASGYTITQIVINCGGSNNGQDITASVGSVSKSGNNSTWTGSITSSSPLVLTMGSQCRPSTLDVTYTAPAASVATPTFSPAAGTYTSAQNVALSCTTTGATIYYTLDGSTPTSSSTAYSSPINVSETKTITAIAIKGTDASNVASATYTILPVTHAGTSADPYTVSDARNALTANTIDSNTDYYVTGYVAKKNDINGGQMTYWISDDGTMTNNIQCYHGKFTDGADFTGSNAPEVGDLVVVKGKLLIYDTTTYEFAENNEVVSITPRTKVNIATFTATTTDLTIGGTTATTVTNDQAGWTPVAYTYASDDEDIATVDENGVITGVAKGTANITATPVVAALDPTYKVGDSKSIEITVHKPSHTATFSVNGVVNSTDYEEDDDIVFPANPDVLGGRTFVGWATSAIAGTTNTAPAFVTSATMGTGDVTYYAVFASTTKVDGWQKLEPSQITEAGTYAIITTDGHAFNGNISSGHGQTTTNAFAFVNGTATTAPTGTCEITLTAVTGGYTMYNSDHGYLYASAASSGKLAWHDSENSYWSYASSNWKYNANGAYLRSYDSNNTIRTYGSNNGSLLGFAKKTKVTAYSDYCTTVSNESITLTTNVGLGTLASDFDLDFTNVAGLEAYIALENGDKIELKKINKVPAGTGILLRSTNDGEDYTVPVATSTDDVTGNLFVRGTGAAVASSEGGSYNYVLGKHNGEVGFYKAGGMVVPTNKAYIHTTLSEARIAIDFEDVTAIEAVKAQKNDGQFYNLAGQRVAQPTKGMYIVNGKKVIIK